MFISLGFSIILIGLIIIEWLVLDPLLEYVTLFFGVSDVYGLCVDIAEC